MKKPSPHDFTLRYSTLRYSTLRYFSIPFSLALFGFCAIAQSTLAQVVKPESDGKPEKVPAVVVKPTPNIAPGIFAGDEVFYRPGREWGFNLDLNGFTDFRSNVSGMSIVGFGVREDSVGITLAHLYVNSFRKEDSITTSRYYANRLFEALRNDTTVVFSDVKRGGSFGFETIEYDRREVWPQPDPNNPGEMFDSTLVRRHFNAIKTHGRSWIEVHLSKTDYLSTDSGLFLNLLETFEIKEEFERKKLTPVNVNAPKKR